MQTNIGFISRVLFTGQCMALVLFPFMTGAAGLEAGFAGYDGHRSEHWVATWSTALHEPDVAPGLANAGFNNQTLRQIVHTSIGGKQVRVRLSSFGANGVVIGAAHIALSSGGAAIVPSSDRVLTFGGKPSITIPPGAPVVSDPVELAVPELSELAVTLFLPEVTGPATWHFDARQTSYISPPGDFTDEAVMPLDPTAPTVPSWFWLSAIDVMTFQPAGAIAAIGESTTDGAQSTVDANHRWTDELARRLMSQRHHHEMGVVNEGLDGNRMLHDGLGPNALARFDRDVLSQSGLAHVILSLGINDIGAGWPGGTNPDQVVTVDQIIQSYRQLIERAHARGIRVYGATLSPIEGFVVPIGPFSLYSPENEAKRQNVNRWIRTSGEFDGMIDFDSVLRDPDHPSRLLPRLDSGDHAHPSDEGYRAMADVIDVTLFRDGDL